ncbi:MAG: hypothetical protein DI537_05285 [Stutzerimonas stutzeri]|nr:MAG: hypothetical protein DI537_05285 [Stutzerimonas stutzeri]
MVPLLVMVLFRIALEPRTFGFWIAAVAGTWCITVWLAIDFLAVDPRSWILLFKRWGANEVIGWSLPLLSYGAMVTGLTVFNAGAAKLRIITGQSGISRLTAIFISWILLALASKFVLSEGTFIVRIFVFFGALIVSGFFRSAVDRLKRNLVSSAKETVIASAERESSSIEKVQAARVASVIKAVEATPSAPIFQSHERIIAVGAADQKAFDADDVSRMHAEINAALGSERPWPDATLDLREGISQRDLHALFGDSDDEQFEDGDDPYGLLRHLYDASQAPRASEAVPAEPVPSSEGVSFVGIEAVEFVDEEDPDDLSADGVVDAVAEAAARIETENAETSSVDVEPEGAASAEPAVLAAEPLLIDVEIAEEVEEAAAAEEDVSSRIMASRAARVISVFRRLQADGRLESDFAGRILPLIDEGLEVALCETAEGRDLLELRAGFLAASTFDEGDDPLHDPEIAPSADEGGVEFAGPSTVVDGPSVAAEAVASAEVEKAEDAGSEPVPVGDDPAPPTPQADNSVPLEPVEQEAVDAPPAPMPAVELNDEEFQSPAAQDIPTEEPTAMPAHTSSIPAAPVGSPLAGVPKQVASTIGENAEFVRLKEWLSVEALADHDIDRVLDERGRERPDEQEVDYTLRRLKEYAPSPSTRRNALRQMSSLLSKDDEDFSMEELALLKGIVSASSSAMLDRWAFQSASDACRKLVFLFFHDFVAQTVGDMEQRLKDGFPDLEAVTAYRGLGTFTEDLQAAFPQLGGMVQDFMALLDRAEYDFAFAGRQDMNLLVEGGLVDSVPRGSPGVSVNVGVSRLLASRMPASAQQALNRFISIGKLIEPIDLMIIDEGVRSGEAPEKHPIHPMLMELEYRALLEIRTLHDELKRRPQLRAEIPAIIKTRQEDLGARYEAIVRNQEEIERTVLRNREDASRLEHLSESVAALTADLAERDRKISESEEAAKKLPVMDALVSAARQLADRDPRMSLVGTSKLKADVSGGEMAVVLLHGLNMSWQIVDGTKLATNDGAVEVDLIKLCASVRNAQGFSDEGVTRLRIVMVSGEVGRLSHGCVFSIDEALNDPARLFGASELDGATARALGF